MVFLLQHSAGPGCPGRRMTSVVVFWFLISGLIRGSLSSVEEEGKATLQNSTKGIFEPATPYKKNLEGSFNKEVNRSPLLHRSSRELPQTKNENEFSFDDVMEEDEFSEAIKKLPVKSKSLFVIPYFRPGRSGDKNRGNIDYPNTMIPIARFGRSVSDLTSSGLNSENSKSVSKRHETIIPTMRFGKKSDRRQSGNSNSVIPYPRLGRSLPTEDKNDATNNVDEISDDDYVKLSDEEDGDMHENEMHDNFWGSGKRQKKESDEYGTIIPYPRTGRYIQQETDSAKENKRADSDYVLPQIRYGRSVVLLSSPKTEENSKQNSHTFVLPYPRPGRSSKYPEKIGYSKNLQVILPYPRPGRSSLDLNEERLNWDKRQNNYMLPFARLGRSAINIPFESMNNGDLFNDLIISSFPLKSEQKNSHEKPKDTTDMNSVFIIPYPRPGKKSMLTLTGSQGKQRQNNAAKELSDYVLPYPRPGKKSSMQQSPKVWKNFNNENENAQKFVLPYPRPGRSETDWFDENIGVNYQTNENIDGSIYMDIEKNHMKNDDIDSKTINSKEYLWNNSKKSKNTFMLPYARLGRSVETDVPNLALDQYKDVDMDTDYSISDYEPFITESEFTDLHNDEASHLRYKRSTAVIPHPRLGRSEMVIPYPRLGRSDSVVPYPRPGRSNSIVPYPRLGRSNSVVPYPRPGRSNSVVPYPRLGRSNSVVPYPRLGRSNSIVPYPRPGRSDSLIPYLRPSRSNSVLPYPRPGRSNSLVPYPRPGRSDSVLLIPRLRRSVSAIPYPRLGHSRKEGEMPNSENEDKARNWMLPNIRPGRSDSFESEADIIPYPRPGRSQNDLLQTEDFSYSVFDKRLIEDMIIPYPRPGRSQKYVQGYILPNPRFGRSNTNMDEVTSSNTVIPYPRVGRSQERVTPSPDLISQSHKLNKHMLSRADDSIYILPYPRPGRYTE